MFVEKNEPLPAESRGRVLQGFVSKIVPPLQPNMPAQVFWISTEYQNGSYSCYAKLTSRNMVRTADGKAWKGGLTAPPEGSRIQFFVEFKLVDGIFKPNAANIILIEVFSTPILAALQKNENLLSSPPVDLEDKTPIVLSQTTTLVDEEEEQMAELTASTGPIKEGPHYYKIKGGIVIMTKDPDVVIMALSESTEVMKRKLQELETFVSTAVYTKDEIRCQIIGLGDIHDEMSKVLHNSGGFSTIG